MNDEMKNDDLNLLLDLLKVVIEMVYACRLHAILILYQLLDPMEINDTKLQRNVVQLPE